MQSKRFIIAAAAAIALAAVGCAEPAGPQLSEADPDDVDLVERLTGVRCSDKAWLVEFYAEPELINLVGGLECSQCFGPQTAFGTFSSHTRLAYEFVCDLR